MGSESTNSQNMSDPHTDAEIMDKAQSSLGYNEEVDQRPIVAFYLLTSTSGAYALVVVNARAIPKLNILSDAFLSFVWKKTRMKRVGLLLSSHCLPYELLFIPPVPPLYAPTTTVVPYPPSSRDPSLSSSHTNGYLDKEKEVVVEKKKTSREKNRSGPSGGRRANERCLPLWVSLS
ncbi:hypothetical protein Adt_29904 [Abeliophyllum distichum]|uniref:Uncharacterized protein n=1 Tax=Abeliophyllum distichum TaxID=126358 RepID=A0ABD1R9P5_9LAMI